MKKPEELHLELPVGILLAFKTFREKEINSDRFNKSIEVFPLGQIH